MGIFSNIFSKIMNVAHAATNTDNKPSTNSPSTSQPSSPAQNQAQTQAAPQTQQQAASAPQQHVDVEAILKNLASKAGTKFNYQTSIVDLLKLLNMDSSLDSRRKLADELHYSGDKNNTEAMNIWLIKQVYGKLSENGGKVPDNWKA
ncbi:DUF3597 family protein [Aristophania vespae]|uniref:DUF3597 family protein n=1 Tax=Aristophania vespae TaxID=2697033 RepID=A0A6P1NG93_9PROT|nr:DUF3597 domain-containing protein [Aristophania vespae]QHI96263.1 DUF3597 family protein [Aristophania vespae]UMM64067.1 hypothetical protein DM15PD_10500 [Aristophania vespae]